MKRDLLTLLLLGLVATGLGFVVGHGRHLVAAKRLRTVVDGAIYRGAEQEGLPYERILRSRDIRTVLNLQGADDDPREAIETALVEQLGLKRVRIPMPGTGKGEFALLDRAADVIADKANHPVFLHCAAGVHRTGAVVAVYRMRYEGVDLETALAEMDEQGARFDKGPELEDHMRAWHAQWPGRPR